MNKKILSLVAIGVMALPMLALAVNNPLANPTGSNVSNDIAGLLNVFLAKLWIVFAGIAVLMFVIAGILFLTARGNPEGTQTARNAFLWGVVGVVVGIIAYSIVAIAGSLIGS